HRHRLCARPRRGPDQGVLSGSLLDRDLRHHGAGAAGEARRAVRASGLTAQARIKTMTDLASSATAAGTALAETDDGAARLHRNLFIAIAAALVVAPFVAYPVFVMKVLCFALFALAFNLLLGYGGLLSFGHAAY